MRSSRAAGERRFLLKVKLSVCVWRRRLVWRWLAVVSSLLGRDRKRRGVFVWCSTNI